MENNYNDLINDLDDEYIIEPVWTLAAKVKKVMCFENKVIKNKDKPFMNDLLEWRDNYIMLGFIPILVGTHVKLHAFLDFKN